MPLTTTLLDAALMYASLGFHVLPLHYPIINAKNKKVFCSCYLGSDCTSIGKHPQYHETLIKHGVHDATTNPEQIKAWWAAWPKANVGIAAGKQSNLFVIDADSTIIVNDAEQRGLPLTPGVSTGRGKHAWFKHPGFIVPNKVKIEGFDFRGDGGLVVAPPSLHEFGVRYEWSTDLDTPLADCPGWITALITQSKQFTGSAELRDAIKDTPYGLGALKRALKALSASHNGTRNNTLYEQTASLYNLVAGGELLAATVDFELASAAEGIGLDPDEIEKTLHSARLNGSSNPRNAPKPKNPKPDVDLLRFSNTDIGNGERIVALHGDDIHYVSQWETWIFWNGKYWQQDTIGYVPRLAYAMVKLLRHLAVDIEDKDARKKALNWALGSHSRKAVDNMLATAKNQLGIRIDATAFDKDPWLLNVENGTLNLQTGQLQPHQQSDLITRMITTPFNPKAQAPTWLNFLNVVFADDTALIEYVQRAVGYSITGDVREDCLHFAFGGGGNGKSTFFKALETLLGEYAHKSPSSMLMAQKFEGIPVDVAALQGKRLVVASELSKNIRWNEAKIKDLTGGDKLTARYMRANPFSFEPTHKLWVYGNYKPVVTGSDDGIWRRLRLVPFTVKINDAMRNENFDALLIPELSGILNWAIQGCLAWQQCGLKPVETITHATKDYQEEMDRLQAFLDEYCIAGATERCLFRDLYTTYSNQCKALSEFAISKREFQERLTRKGYTFKTGHANQLYAFGIRYLTIDELKAQHASAKKELADLVFEP
jgi:putative DNA primase/helicase